jgi:hypothetical protein
MAILYSTILFLMFAGLYALGKNAELVEKSKVKIPIKNHPKK